MTVAKKHVVKLGQCYKLWIPYNYNREGREGYFIFIVTSICNTKEGKIATLVDITTEEKVTRYIPFENFGCYSSISHPECIEYVVRRLAAHNHEMYEEIVKLKATQHVHKHWWQFKGVKI